MGRPHDNSSSVQKAAVIPDLDLNLTQGEKLLHHTLQKEESSIVRVVKPGDSFLGIFSVLNFKSKETPLILKAFQQLEVTTLFPGDSLVIKRTSDSSFSSLHFFTSLQNKFTISNKDSCLLAQRETLPVSTYRYLLNGSLETSLSEAMFTLGVGDVIAASIADIFAWDINFFLDPRKGDTFQVIFEKKVVNGRSCGYGTVLAAKYTLSDQKSYYAFGFPDIDGKINYFDCDGNAVQKQFLKAPLRYSRVSSGFSYRRKHPILGIVRPHFGIDYAAPYGTPVHAAADGKIIFAGKKGDYGNQVVVSHGGAYQTFYGHLQSFAKNIHRGLYVKQGDMLGRVGATGLATGPHLDYRMQRGGSFVNPMKIASPPIQAVSEGRRNEFMAVKEKYQYLFEKRFSSQTGCFLLDIVTQEPVEPKRIILKKPLSIGNGSG